MKKFIAIVQVYLLALAVLALVTVTVASAIERPIRQDEKLGDTPEYQGVTVITSGTNLAETKYISTTDEENALLVTGGSSYIERPTVTKSGEGYHSWVNLGSNAGILVKDGAALSIKGGSVTTSGNYSPGIFTDIGTLKLQATSISTSGNYSAGLAATARSSITATDVSLVTSGSQSPALRTISGGSNVSISGGEYSTRGNLSPTIYALSHITVKDATFTSSQSESLIIEGANSVSIESSTLESTTATAYSGTAERAGIFLYQSASTRDAPVGTTALSVKDSTLTTNQGDAIFVTNANANLTLENNIINNENGAFLRAIASNWGEPGVNGGNVTLTMKNQSVKGDLITDGDSSLSLTLSGSSSITGAINNANSMKNISLTLSADSIITLTGNSYITSLKNADPDNYNIRLNGYTLEVDGVVLTSTYRGNIVVDDDYDPFEETPAEDTDFLTSIPVWVLPVSIIASILVFASLAGFIVYKIQKKDQIEQPPLPPQIAPGSTNSSQPPAPPVPPSIPLSA